jgi:hypothetical protein
MDEAFEPEYGSAGYSELWDAITPKECRAKELPVDWLTYFSRDWGTVPPLPAPVRIEPLGRGMLITLTPERASPDNPEHVELGRQVRALLGKAGLLERRVAE